MEPTHALKTDRINKIKCIECDGSDSFNWLFGKPSGYKNNTLLTFHMNIRRYCKNMEQVLNLLKDLDVEFDMIVYGEARLTDDLS